MDQVWTKVGIRIPAQSMPGIQIRKAKLYGSIFTVFELHEADLQLDRGPGADSGDIFLLLADSILDSRGD